MNPVDLYCICHTGDVDMNNESNLQDHGFDNRYLKMTALENERKQQREETLKWISTSALSKLRSAWGH